jgi:hypothetical protein
MATMMKLIIAVKICTRTLRRGVTTCDECKPSAEGVSAAGDGFVELIGCFPEGKSGLRRIENRAVWGGRVLWSTI